MSARQAVIWGVVLAVLTIGAIFIVDAPIAAMVKPAVAENRAAVNPFIDALELLFGFPISKFLTGAVIILAALILFPFRRWRAWAWVLLFIGSTHLVTRLIAGVLKNVFLRVRPFEGAAAGQFFVDGGSSFPSGHAAHFWALFFAMAMVFPKLRVWIWFLLLAIAVSASRVVVNDHFAGDVLGSASIAAFVCAAFARMIRARVPGSA